MSIDLDEIAGCPLGVRCECCGLEATDPDDDLADRRAGSVELRVATTHLGPMGVSCLTVCGQCRDSGDFPSVSIVAAARLVCRHAEHLGIDLDQMAAALDEETR